MRPLLVLWAVPLVAAELPWGGLAENNPAEIGFSLRLAAPPAYRQGERIEIEVAFQRSPSTPGAISDESWQFAGVLLDPAGECGTIEKPCTTAYERWTKTDPLNMLQWRSRPVRTALNNYVPPFAPGRYRVALLARMFVLKSREGTSAIYGYPDMPVLAVSNAVEFEILPVSGDWLAQTVEHCLKAIDVPEPVTGEATTLRRAAAQQLSFLDDPLAWSASLDLLPAEEGVLLSGLAVSEHPAEVCSLMRERLAAPKQAVSLFYMARMVEICRRADLPAPAAIGAPEEDRAKYRESYHLYTASLERQTHAELAASLPRKQPEAKAGAFEALMRRVQYLRLNEPEEPVPEWVPTLRREFAAVLLSSDRGQQQRLLRTVGAEFVGPEAAPALEALIEAWKPGDYYETVREALRFLHMVDARRAQAKILAELPKPRTWMDAGLLELLPASAVPPMDDVLIEALAEAQRPGGWNPLLRMTALAKYATADSLPRMRAIFESQQNPCQPELMAYFVRVDPEYAERVFRRQPWDMQADPPPCALQYFERTAALAMHPVLEQYMAAFLMHRMVPVKRRAAHSLARYGSAAAVGPLWDAFHYFHDYWKDQGRPNQEGVILEVALRNAIARGRNWLAGETDLRLMESLCISAECASDARQDLAAWQGAPQIEIYEQARGIRASVAQYSDIETMEALEAKLAQFPRGTQFALTLRRTGGSTRGVRNQALRR